MARAMTMAEKLAKKVQPLHEEANPPAPAVSALPASAPVEDKPAAEEPATMVAEAPVEKSATARESTTPRKRRTPANGGVATESAPSASASLILTLEADLNERLLAYRATTRKSHTVILMDAVEATYDRLPELVRAALGIDDEPKPARKLFERSPMTATPISTGPRAPRVQHTIRTTLTNRQQLDEITKETGAPSRNFLIVTAYDAFLPKV